MDCADIFDPEKGSSFLHSSSLSSCSTSPGQITKAESGSLSPKYPDVPKMKHEEQKKNQRDSNLAWKNADRYSGCEDDDLGSGSDEFELNFPPRGKRLAPVGADAVTEVMDGKAQLALNLDPDNSSLMKMGFGTQPTQDGTPELQKKLLEMEEEQEELNTSLMSITSHFAKVQLRLQQVVNAPAERREELLKELEHFAFRGIPDLTSPRIELNKSPVEESHEATPDANKKMVDNQILEAQRKKHTDLIQQLKGQLDELESYAYESGESIVPSTMLLERQRVVMEQLKTRLNLNMDNIIQLSEDELKAEVDSAVGQIVHPLKMKNQLVDQLQTQINDLEMFIEFLQSENSIVPNDCQECGCSKHNSPNHGSSSKVSRPKERRSNFRSRTKSEQEEIHKQTMSILQKAIAVLQLSAISQFGCGGREPFYKNTLKNTTKGNHYGDLRANLELSVDRLLDACSQTDTVTDIDTDSVTSTDIESHTEYLMSSPVITAIVRREVATALRDLMEHGLYQGSRGSSLVPFMGCMSSRSANSAKTIKKFHAWDIILKFYHLKQGNEYNSAPQRKLSASFGLDLSGASSNNKQSLLSTIGQIMTTHGPYKRSADAHFKAFICAGLNKRKLIPWLKLILHNQNILETYYQPWSYVVKTGFDDAFRAVDRLSMYVFDLPVDVAVKQFQDMREAF